VKRIVFEVTLEAKNAGIDSDVDEVGNIVSIIRDGLGYPDPEKVKIKAKVLRREEVDVP
jgi:hypothetical protein